jgi:hypothetical protein
MRLISAKSENSATPPQPAGSPFTPRDKEPDVRLKDRVQREPVPLLRLIEPGEFAVQLGHECAHLIGWRRDLHNLDRHALRQLAGHGFPPCLR